MKSIGTKLSFCLDYFLFPEQLAAKLGHYVSGRGFQVDHELVRAAGTARGGGRLSRQLLAQQKRGVLVTVLIRNCLVGKRGLHFMAINFLSSPSYFNLRKACLSRLGPILR